MFQVTPNVETFQARYVIIHPATGEFNCDEGKKYLQDLKKRRKAEINELMNLTGKNVNTWLDIASAKNDEQKDITAQYASIINDVQKSESKQNNSLGGMILLCAVALGGLAYYKTKGMV
jgi:DNA phosphorothioation-dependent restriction protein DptG